jgi:hypothetical protein
MAASPNMANAHCTKLRSFLKAERRKPPGLEPSDVFLLHALQFVDFTNGMLGHLPTF